jgi:Concanavalin A-like lectin/glucanases superfamily
VAEYRFAGSAADTSGSGRPGVVHGATLTADRFGNANHAYFFDGVDDYIEIAPPPTLSVPRLSVSAWVRYEPHDFRGWTNCIVAQDDGNDEDQSRRVFQLSTDNGHIVWHRMVCSRDAMCRRRVRPGVWCHVVGVHDGGVNRLYVDGVLHDTVEHELWIHATQPMHIGRKGTPEPFFFFHGAIDDVRVYDRALGDADVESLLHEGGWQPPPSQPVLGDPLSGRWGQHGVVFLDLRYDGDREVTGQIMAGQPNNMTPITAGTFDPRSGAILLKGSATDPKHGGPFAYSIEGLLDDGEVTVTARFSDYSGNFMLTRRGGSRLRFTRRSIRSQLGALTFRLRGAAFPRSDRR